jgi:hypothetical protein
MFLHTLSSGRKSSRGFQSINTQKAAGTLIEPPPSCYNLEKIIID